MSLIRRAAFAGRFYPASSQHCHEFCSAPLPAATAIGDAVAVVMPHAGWAYSGSTALQSAAALGAARPETIVVFGAVHVLDRNLASLYPAGAWETPVGSLRVDEELASRIVRAPDVTVDPDVHAEEHSIEVELPLIRELVGDVAIVPIMVRPGPHAAELGRAVARAALELSRRVAFVASTDLTHYGPNFGFEPHGRGEAGLRWAQDVNDRSFIRCMGNLDAAEVIAEAAVNRNACGAGAVAATIAAAAELGAGRYVELAHTSSAEVEAATGGTPLNSVGYAAGAFVL